MTSLRLALTPCLCPILCPWQREMEEYRQKRIYQRAIESFYEKMRRDTIQKVYDDARVEEVRLRAHTTIKAAKLETVSFHQWTHSQYG